MSISRSTKSSSIELSSKSLSSSTKRGIMRGRAFAHLDRMDWAIRVLVVLAIVSLVATIVLLGLAMAQYIQPLLPLYTFSGCIAAVIVAKTIDCCQRSIAKKNQIELEEYYDARQPIPQKKEDPSPKKNDQ